MKPAERLKVGLSMVITRHDVVHVRCRFLAALPVLITGSAAMSVSAQDAASNLGPVRRKMLAAIRS